ncbi:cytochrome P450 [Pilatotrama ljubarskyi]|nr:cytochrome P450 [Pilatotrama ljubarskyi]
MEHDALFSFLKVPCAFAILILLLLYLRSVVEWRARARGRPLPPGPKRLPIIGNMLDVPVWKPWLGYRDLTARFGDIVYLETLGKPMVVLGSPATIFEFLEKHSANTADRATTPLVPLTGHSFNFAFMPYGLAWRRHRRMLWQHFHPGRVPSYRPVQRALVHEFLVKLLEKPHKLQQLLRYNVVATTLKITYGIDWMMRSSASAITVSVQFLLQHFPILQHLPSWFPGAGFHELLAQATGPSQYMLNTPFSEARAKATQPVDLPSIVADLVSRIASQEPGQAEDEEQIARDVAAIIVEGKSYAQKTFSSMEGLFLGLSLNPEVQKKAQAELAAVVGPNRLPDFEDRDALVYVNAIVKEALRWHNVAPLSIAHYTMEDDELNGYIIPARTTVVPNVWACMHDPQMFAEPDEFRPERFIRDGKLNPDVLDPTTLVFGSGRRICPGRYFADAALFLTAACVLHVFDIGPPLDENGRPVQVKYEPSHGFLSYPEDGRCTIKARSAEAVALILGSREKGSSPE